MRCNDFGRLLLSERNRAIRDYLFSREHHEKSLELCSVDGREKSVFAVEIEIFFPGGIDDRQTWIGGPSISDEKSTLAVKMSSGFSKYDFTTMRCMCIVATFNTILNSIARLGIVVNHNCISAWPVVFEIDAARVKCFLKDLMIHWEILRSEGMDLGGLLLELLDLFLRNHLPEWSAAYFWSLCRRSQGSLYQTSVGCIADHRLLWRLLTSIDRERNALHPLVGV